MLCFILKHCSLNSLKNLFCHLVSSFSRMAHCTLLCENHGWPGFLSMLLGLTFPPHRHGACILLCTILSLHIHFLYESRLYRHQLQLCVSCSGVTKFPVTNFPLGMSVYMTHRKYMYANLCCQIENLIYLSLNIQFFPCE